MKRRRGILKRYIVSYMGVALIACLLIGVFCLATSIVQLDAIYVREREYKLQTACEDLSTQLGAMRNITLRIKTTVCYLPLYFSESTLKEREIIEDLSKFKDYLPYACEYYLCYLAERSVYSNQTKYSLDIFSSHVAGRDDSGVLFDELSKAKEISIIRWDELPDAIVFIFPIDISGAAARIMYVVRESDLLERCAGVSGLAREALSIRVNGASIAGPTLPDDAISFQNAEHPELSVAIMSDGIIDRFGGLILRIAALMAVVAVLVILVSIYKAYQNYKPIEHILESYIPAERADSSDELQTIEHMLDSAMHESRTRLNDLQNAILRLNEQRDMLREYVLIHLLQNGPSDNALAELESLGVSISEKHLFLWRLTFVSARQLLTAVSEIEALSDADAEFIAVRSAPDELFVIAATREEENINCAVEMFEALLGQLHPSRVALGGGCESVEELNALWLRIEHPENVPRKFARATSELDELCQAIDAMDESRAANILRDILSSARSENSPPFLQKGLYAEMVDRLLGYHQAENMRWHTDMLMKSLHSGDPMQFAGCAGAYISELIARMRSNDGEALERKMLKYINSHLCEYSFSLECVAEALGVSTRFVSRAVKEKTGLSYIDYVKERRMSLAQKLLLETRLSVAEIGTRVGYVNISYFIRAFKNFSGLTPASYRSSPAFAARLREDNDAPEA